MSREEEYIFDENRNKKRSKLSTIAHFLWNSHTKEFCGRDGGSWAKVTFFYAIFYAVLGSFFIGMLAVFFQIMPKDKPTYYNTESVMNSRTKVNPGLGFRPQVDVEDSLINYNPGLFDNKKGYKPYSRNLKNFLDAKYAAQEEDGNLIDCKSGSTYEDKLRNGKVCRFDYSSIFANTECNEENAFNFNTPRPCFLIKMNKIVDWMPVLNNSQHIEIKCNGEHSADRDNVKKIVYHSEEHINDEESGKLSLKYFPFYSQKNYLAPFIWVQMDITPNTLVNIQCKAYAENIDNEDRMHRRGQTKFGVFISNTN